MLPLSDDVKLFDPPERFKMFHPAPTEAQQEEKIYEPAERTIKPPNPEKEKPVPIRGIEKVYGPACSPSDNCKAFNPPERFKMLSDDQIQDDEKVYDPPRKTMEPPSIGLVENKTSREMVPSPDGVMYYDPPERFKVFNEALVQDDEKVYDPPRKTMKPPSIELVENKTSREMVPSPDGVMYYDPPERFKVFNEAVIQEEEKVYNPPYRTMKPRVIKPDENSQIPEQSSLELSSPSEDVKHHDPPERFQMFVEETVTNDENVSNTTEKDNKTMSDEPFGDLLPPSDHFKEFDPPKRFKYFCTPKTHMPFSSHHGEEKRRIEQPPKDAAAVVLTSPPLDVAPVVENKEDVYEGESKDYDPPLKQMISTSPKQSENQEERNPSAPVISPQPGAIRYVSPVQSEPMDMYQEETKDIRVLEKHVVTSYDMEQLDQNESDEESKYYEPEQRHLLQQKESEKDVKEYDKESREMSTPDDYNGELKEMSLQEKEATPAKAALEPLQVVEILPQTGEEITASPEIIPEAVLNEEETKEPVNQPHQVYEPEMKNLERVEKTIDYHLIAETPSEYTEESKGFDPQEKFIDLPRGEMEATNEEENQLVNTSDKSVESPTVADELQNEEETKLYHPECKSLNSTEDNGSSKYEEETKKCELIERHIKPNSEEDVHPYVHNGLQSEILPSSSRSEDETNEYTGEITPIEENRKDETEEHLLESRTMEPTPTEECQEDMKELTPRGLEQRQPKLLKSVPALVPNECLDYSAVVDTSPAAAASGAPNRVESTPNQSTTPHTKPLPGSASDIRAASVKESLISTPNLQEAHVKSDSPLPLTASPMVSPSHPDSVGQTPTEPGTLHTAHTSPIVSSSTSSPAVKLPPVSPYSVPATSEKNLPSPPPITKPSTSPHLPKSPGPIIKSTPPIIQSPTLQAQLSSETVPSSPHQITKPTTVRDLPRSPKFSPSPPLDAPPPASSKTPVEVSQAVQTSLPSTAVKNGPRTPDRTGVFKPRIEISEPENQPIEYPRLSKVKMRAGSAVPRQPPTWKRRKKSDGSSLSSIQRSMDILRK